MITTTTRETYTATAVDEPLVGLASGFIIGSCSGVGVGVMVGLGDIDDVIDERGGRTQLSSSVLEIFVGSALPKLSY